jgi:hypothetical protein
VVSVNEILGSVGRRSAVGCVGRGCVDGQGEKGEKGMQEREDTVARTRAKHFYWYQPAAGRGEGKVEGHAPVGLPVVFPRTYGNIDPRPVRVQCLLPRSPPTNILPLLWCLGLDE